MPRSTTPAPISSRRAFPALKALPERTAFRAAQSVGYAITEVKYPSLRERADEVIQSLIDKVSNG